LWHRFLSRLRFSYAVTLVDLRLRVEFAIDSSLTAFRCDVVVVVMFVVVVVARRMMRSLRTFV